MYFVFSSSFVMSQDLSLNSRMRTESEFNDREYSGSNVPSSSNERHSRFILSSCGKGQIETLIYFVVFTIP